MLGTWEVLKTGSNGPKSKYGELGLYTLEKEMTTHSSILAWEIPWTEEPGGLESLGSHRVGHDLATKQQQSCLYTRKNAVME